MARPRPDQPDAAGSLQALGSGVDLFAGGLGGQEMEQLVRLGSDLLLEVRARLRGHDSTPSRPDVGEGA